MVALAIKWLHTRTRQGKGYHKGISVGGGSREEGRKGRRGRKGEKGLAEEKMSGREGGEE